MSFASQLILVTGGTGFLGSHVVQQLLEDGYRVRCTARPLKSRFLEAAHFERVRIGQLEVVEVNDLALESLGRVLVGITAVIHTAFPTPGSMDDTELLMNATSSTTSLLRQAYEHGIRKFVLTSSYLAMVGASTSVEADDDDDDDDWGRQGVAVDSGGVWSDYVFSDQDWTHATYESVFTGTTDPAWAYAAAKTLAETAAWDFASARPDLDLATVLPTLLLGPFAPGHAILSTSDLSTNVLLQSLLTSGTPPQPVWPHFVDVRDAARAHVAALEAPSLGGHGSVASTNSPSTQSGIGQGLEPGQSSAPPLRSRPRHLTLPYPSSSPSLVDLGATLQDLEKSFQGTLGSASPSQFPSTTPQSPGSPSARTPPGSVRAQTPTTPHRSPDTAESSTSPTSPTQTQPTSASASTSTFTSPSTSPSPPVTAMAQTHAPRPRKRFLASGTSFTWPAAIAHLRTARPDLADTLPNERACLPIPERVARVDGTWSGAAWARAVGLCADDVDGGVHSHVEDEGGGGSDRTGTGGAGVGGLEEHVAVWSGLGVRWRDWRETVEDAVRDLERVAGGLERSGWEDLFGGDDDDDDVDDKEDETRQPKEGS